MTRLFVLAIVFFMLLLSSPANAIPLDGGISIFLPERYPPSQEDFLIGHAIASGILLTLSAIWGIIRLMWDRFHYRDINSSPSGRPKPPWQRFMDLNLNAMKWLAPKILQNLIWEIGKWLLDFRRQHRPQVTSATATG